MTDPLAILVVSLMVLLAVVVAAIGVTLALDHYAARAVGGVDFRSRTDDPNWLLALLAEEEDWPTWYPGAGVDHLYPDCHAYQRSPHRRDLKGDAVPGVGQPSAERICGHCRRRADREELPASA